MNPLTTIKGKLEKEFQETDRDKYPGKRVLILQDLADLERIRQKALTFGLTFETENQVWIALEKSMYSNRTLDIYLKNLADQQKGP